MAASVLVPVLVAGGGIALVAAQADPPAPAANANAQLTPPTGFTIGEAMGSGSSQLDSLTAQLKAIDERLTAISLRLYGAGKVA